MPAIDAIAVTQYSSGNTLNIESTRIKDDGLDSVTRKKEANNVYQQRHLDVGDVVDLQCDKRKHASCTTR